MAKCISGETVIVMRDKYYLGYTGKGWWVFSIKEHLLDGVPVADYIYHQGPGTTK